MQKNELEVVNIRLVKEPSLYSEKPLHSPEDVKELVAKELAYYDREVMCVLNMKTNGQVINAVRGERYRKDICRVHQLSEQCGYLVKYQICTIEQLKKQQTDLKSQKQQMKKSGEEEQMKMLQAELRIVNRILRETKESAVGKTPLNLGNTALKENTTSKGKEHYAKR